MENLLRKIKESFDLNLAVHEKVTKGFLSENHVLSDSAGKKYFLKRYRFDNEKKIAEIHLAKKFFADGGIPVILPIMAKDGKTFFEFSGSYFALFPFVDGIQPERGKLSDKMVVSLGKMLGRIHLVGKGSHLQKNSEFKSWSKDKSLKMIEMLENEIQKIDTKSDFDKLALRNILFKKEEIEKNTVIFKDLGLSNDHLVHGDYTDQNVFFDGSGEVTHVFDFEKTGYEPRSQELLRSAIYASLGTGFDEESIRKTRLQINAYFDKYPMPKEELKNGLIAYYVKSIHGFWVEEEHYLKGNTRADVFLESNYLQLKFLSENLKTLLL